MMDEQTLIRASRQGDLEAFNQLLLRYQDFLFSIALRMLGDEDSAADATQNALLSAFRKFGNFRDGSLRGWLARVVINACYDELRRQNRHPLMPLEQVDADGDEIDADDWLADFVAGPEEQFETRELNRAVEKGLHMLPSAYRTMLVLVDIEGLSYEEAAAAVQVPVGTVKSRLARARLQMRRLLHGFDEPLPVSYRIEFAPLMKV